ncbi:winged helix-turn-helix domain-containing protein [Sulfuracidifex metallicus]|jgi:DNA-binding transcriptional ArsR family regulator|uniref:ArsR family transcriptional regulator n=1 Tax=Sulfuracidifex metallicus DSM 6482 = JCM 9184 TaxID=523847 RepID=A0A6A9QJY4_SULME|nr:winged helix-turn-helix domain-containing protein [Sulfuracidifex metallicus]MUN29316.1 ArsR family transcriptional regulator [Sulfuracidifex metallicus DSM 6482 = JCM 9184]WOE50171.1 winged helix-turn-helix domain-containing protein [Sulfuracidifex metallicus DSM 6482 = JCM 9184]
MAELSGTTLKIYNYMIKQKKPVRLTKIQRDLNMSSKSLVHYHLKKLMEEGLIREVDDGYVVSKVVLEDYIRIRNTILPNSMFLASFFLTSLVIFIALSLFYQGTGASEIFGFLSISTAAVYFIRDVLKKMKNIST